MPFVSSDGLTFLTSQNVNLTDEMYKLIINVDVHEREWSLIFDLYLFPYYLLVFFDQYIYLVAAIVSIICDVISLQLNF